jgi:hypothetical protein
VPFVTGIVWIVVVAVELVVSNRALRRSSKCE